MESAKLLERGELHLYPGLRHGLTAIADEVAERIDEFVRGLPSES